MSLIHFYIKENLYHKKNLTVGYCHDGYQNYVNTNGGQGKNPIHYLKNTFNNNIAYFLTKCKYTISNIIAEDISKIVELEKLTNPVIVNVPRAKKLELYFSTQLMFSEAVADAVSKVKGAVNGTNIVVRIKNTVTSHLANSKIVFWKSNQGDLPIKEGIIIHPGITLNTCTIDLEKVMGKTIILIDDVYTPNAFIDDDCVQALYDSGASKVIFYAITHSGICENVNDLPF